MRTTVNIDEHLLGRARDEARAKGETLGQYLEDAIRLKVSEPKKKKGPPIPAFQGEGGMRPGIDPRSNRSLFAAADEGISPEKLR